MSESFQLLIQHAAGPIAWTLIHSLWIGGLVALVLAGSLSLTRSRSPQLRYIVACVALLLVTPLSVSTALYLSMDGDSSLAAANGTSSTEIASTHPESVPIATIGVESEAATFDIRAWLHNPPLSLIFAVWLAGVFLISIYHLLGWRRAKRIIRLRTEQLSAPWQKRIERLLTRMDIGFHIRVLKAPRIKMPCVVGWIKPTVLLPVSALSGLSIEELEMIIAHELAHVRRHDVLVNYIQSAIETVMFFNPAVWWISRRIRIEREHCCDDVAAEVCGNRLAYARALTNLESLRSTRPHLATAADGTSLLKRVRRLTRTSASSGRWHGLSVVSVLSLVTLLVFAVSGITAFAPVDATAAIDASAPGTYVEESDDFHGWWELEPGYDHFALTMRFRPNGSSTFSLDPEDLIGLAEGKAAQFRLVRDAGTFYFEGDVEKDGDEYYGEGDCHFRPDPNYVEQMDELGFRVGSRRKSFELALHDVELEFVRGLRDLGYSGFSLSKLLEMHIHRVTPEFVSELAELGYKDLSVSRLVEMRIHKATPDYIRGLKEIGYDDLSPSELVEMRIHRVDPEYVKAFEELGMDRVSRSKLVEMSIHRVTPDYIEALKELGYENLSPSKLVEMRIHRVDPDYIRGLVKLGYTDLKPSRLVEMRIHRVEPYYIESLQELGLKDIDPEDLVAMRIHDVTPSFIERLKEKGYDDLTPDDLIEYKIHGTKSRRYNRSDMD